MTKSYLEIEVPSELIRDFRSALHEHEVKHVPVIEGAKPSLNPSDAQDAIIWFKLALEVVGSEAFWGAVSAAILAFARRHAKKSIYVETDGFKFKATGMSQDELAKSLESATKLILTSKKNDSDE